MKVTEMDGRTVASSGAVWEDIVGYRRAVRRGNQIVVTGTVGVNEDGTFPESVTEQARKSLETIISALEALGGQRSDVIRTTIYLTNARDWEAVGKIHAEYFRDIRPATTIVEVSALVPPEAYVEIELDALLL
jgi:enamine deaminase RidA (YjgF/YER057c/UK114 family)